MSDRIVSLALIAINACGCVISLSNADYRKAAYWAAAVVIYYTTVL